MYNFIMSPYHEYCVQFKQKGTFEQQLQKKVIKDEQRQRIASVQEESKTSWG